MPDEQAIYQHHADLYEKLISYEDYQGNILRGIQDRVRLPVSHIVDLGAGTGRLTRLLAPFADCVTAFDLSTQMLLQARQVLEGIGYANYRAAAANHRHIPLPSASADLVVSGWSLCYLVTWGGDGWKERLTQALAEVRRILRPGGSILIFETLGTGHETPNPPEHLQAYYAFLEELSFQAGWMRTDYRFPSLETARELAAFFFGEEMGEKVSQNQWQILPECTGVWQLHAQPASSTGS